MIVDTFPTWANSAPLARRVEAAEAIARRYLHPQGDDDQRALLTNLFVMLDDPAIDVRQRLADVLADRFDAPRAIVLRLLDDVPSVSAILYQRSPLVRVSHLREAMQRGEARLERAIAQRMDLEDDMVHALLDHSDVDACKALVSNPYVRLGSQSITQFISRFAADNEALETLQATRKLSAEHRCLLVAACAQAYQANAFVRALVPGKRLERLADSARERSLVDVLCDLDEAACARAIGSLHPMGAITPALVLRVAMGGDIAVLEALVACLAQTPAARVRSAFVHARPAVAAALLKRTGLPEDVRLVLSMALVMARELAQADVTWTQYFFCETLIEVVDQSASSGAADGLGAAASDETLALCHSIAADIMQAEARASTAQQAAPYTANHGVDVIDALIVEDSLDLDLDLDFAEIAVTPDDAFDRAVAA